MKGYHFAAAALAASLASACAHTGSLPFAGTGGTNAPANARVTAHIEPASDFVPPRSDGADAAPCRHPQFPVVCVKRGHSATLGIKITCTRNGNPVACGTVTWSTKPSNKGLTASFEPNPGNPTTETIHAAKTLRLGKYSQSITTKCSNVPDCPKDYLAPIYVVAK